MMQFSRTFVSALVAGVVLTGCGGGGSLSGETNTIGTNTGNTNTISWTQGVFEDDSNFKGQCDALSEKHWLRAWSHETYLWYDEITDRNPADTADVIDYFNLLKTEELTESGAKKDNFHFSMSTAEWVAMNQSGISLGYGFDFQLLQSAPPRRAVVTFTEPNTPASTNNLQRGWEIVSIDGEDFINGNNVNVLNDGLFPSEEGKVTEFVFKDINNNELSFSLTAGEIESTPVQNVKVIPTDSGNVGYFQFNAHIATAERGLYDAITELSNANISDLVVDLRYNGGGLLAMASQLGYMIAGSDNTANRTFERTIFNDQYPTVNPVTGQALQPMPFIDFYIGFDPDSGVADEAPLPSLNLDRVYVLTTGGTCSASEALINGLRGVDIEVIQIGTTSCGKPYGFYPTDNCDTTYFTIQFTGVNDKGFGEYSDGFTPVNTIDNALMPVSVPGCSVADDYSKALGDPSEGLLAAALDYRTSGTCPAPASTASKYEVLQSRDAGLEVKSKHPATLLKQNRILTEIRQEPK